MKDKLLGFFKAQSPLTNATAILILLFLVFYSILRIFPAQQLVAAANFGTTTIGNLTDTGNNNMMTCNKYQTSNSGTLASLSVYVASVDSANKSYSLAIYSDNGTGPGNLLVSANGTLTANSWNTVNAVTSVTAGINYWLCYNSNSTNNSLNSMKYADGSTPIVYKAQTFGTWPVSYGTPGGAWAGNFSLYATVNVPPTPTFTPAPTHTPSPTLLPTSTPTPRPTATPTPVQQSQNWYGQPNWQFRKTITIDRTKVFGTNTNFPVLVSLSTDAGLAANTQTNGNDILFTDSTGLTKIPHEIEKFTKSNGHLVAWVKVPSISSTADTTIYMYYGNPSAPAQQNITGVWDSNYRMVYHMNDSSGALANDSTANNKDALQGTAAQQPIAQSAGQVDTAMDFDGSADNFSVASPNLSTGDFSYQTWIRPDDVTAGTTIFMTPTSNDGNNALALWIANCAPASPGKLCVTMNDTGTNVLIANQTISVGQWYYVAVTRSGSTVSLYINGNLDKTGTNGSAIASMGCSLYIGMDIDGGSGCTGGTKGNYFNGKLDDFKVSTNARTANWIKTEYFNQSSPSTFFSVGAAEQYTTAQPTPTGPTATPAPTQPPVSTHTIAGTVFNDVNRDGNRDSGEPAFSGVTITISGPVVDNNVTDNSGQYSFNGLQPGSYTVNVILPPNATATSPTSRTMTIPGGGTVNFAMVREFTITGNAFNDLNTNGTIQGGEPALQSVAVKLNTDPATVERIVSTDTSGNYTFPNVQGGYDYVISAVNPTGFRSTNPNNINFTLTSPLTFNFGFVRATTSTAPGSCTGNQANIVLVIDDSASMQDTDPLTGRTKAVGAKAAAVNFVRIIQDNLPGTKISLVKFAGAQNFPNDPTRTRVVIPMTNNLNQVISGIQGMQYQATGSCHSCGLDLANKQIQANRGPNTDNYVILLTDGRTNHSHLTSPYVQVGFAIAENDTVEEALEGVNSNNTHYSTISFGVLNSTQTRFLQNVAALNGGVYRNSPTFGDINAVYANVAAINFSIGQIHGNVFNDQNRNGIRDTGEPPIPNWTINATSTSIPNTLTQRSDASGNYAFKGLCTAKYEVAEVIAPPWKPTTVTSYTVGVVSGEIYRGFDFGNRYGYSITGSVFNDIDKNRLKGTTELSVPGSVVAAPQGDVTVNPDGTYSIQGLDEGSYLISYTSALPKDYVLIYPKNGPPPSFLATVGPACAVDTLTGAACGSGGDISNLHFAISNSIPWIQTSDLDVRLDNGFSNKIPATSLYPAFALAQTASADSPGVLFLGNGTADFGSGKASATNWIAGGGLYPEVYKNTSGSISKMSYTNLLAKAQQAKLPITNMTTIPSCINLANCTLPAALASGVYLANGDLNLNAFTVPAGTKYVFLINGDLKVNGNIIVPNGSSAVFAAKNDITIDKNVGTTPVFPRPAGQVQGIYSAEGNFLIAGTDDCVIGADKMFNMEGSVIANAGFSGGRFSYQRDLCGGNPLYPTFTIKPRLDFIFNAPTFIMTQQSYANEVAP